MVVGTGVEGGDGMCWRIVPPLDAVLTLRLEPESDESLPVTRSPARRLGCQSCSDACSMTFWLDPMTKTTWR